MFARRYPSRLSAFSRVTMVAAAGMLALSSIALAPVALAAPGDLDLSFGTGGIVRTYIGSSAGVNAIALQPDGKIVAGGSSSSSGQNVFTLARYLSDGSLDPSFGKGGIVQTPIRSGISSLALQPDGSIVAAGYDSGAFRRVFILARYLNDGSLDVSFGTGGIVQTPIGSANAVPIALALLTDGTIIAGGYSDVSGPPYDVFTLARYLSDGSLDPSFGAAGIVQTPIGAGSASIYSLALQPDGSLVAGGFSTGSDRNVFTLARYLSDGSLDPWFGSAGIVQTPIGLHSVSTTIRSLALQPNGSILAGGSSLSSGQDVFTLVRYLSDGSLDPSFGSAGIVQDPIGDRALITSIALQPDGSIVAAGGSFASFLNPKGFTIARYLSNGSPDSSFGSAGIVQTLINRYALISSLALQPDGNIVAGGGSRIASDFDVLILARYIGGPTFAGTPGYSNCHGESVAALAHQYGGLDAAAAALGYPSVEALQDAIEMYCRG